MLPRTLFQATSLVLGSGPRAVVRDRSAPGRPSRRRTATCRRTTAARHRRLERRAAVPWTGAPDRDFELERLLHEEIDRFPDRFRSRSCSATSRAAPTSRPRAPGLAGRIGQERFSRGRERLRDRLIRRGVARLGPPAVVRASKIPAVAVPPPSLEATTFSAVPFAAIGRLAGRVGGDTPEGVLRTMTMTQRWKVATAPVVAGATASGVEVGAWTVWGPAPASAKERDVRRRYRLQEVRPGKLELIVNGRGSVEAGRTADV